MTIPKPTELFSVWGGTDPGAWCSFLSESALDRGYAYAGTRAEAEAGAAVLAAEYKTTRYDVVRFDHLREPVGSDDLPTPAQLVALEQIDRTGNFTFPIPSSATRHAICNRGWWAICLTSDGENLYHKQSRLTAAGRKALERGRLAHSKGSSR